MSDEKTQNLATSHLLEDEKQQLYKNARAKDWYDDIWKTVGKCVFCDLKDKYILYEENGVVLTINIYPYIDGQLMAIPRRHVKSTNELTQLEWETMRKFGYIAKKMFKKIYGHNAMWSLVKTGVMAQGTVADHLHMHFIPFDHQDLASWSYRELQFTPLENVAQYKNNIKEFIVAYEKYDRKYQVTESRRVVVDLLIIHKSKILMQKRNEHFKYDPDMYTLPGGHIDSKDENLLVALRREVKEEIGYLINEDDVQLINSQLSKLNRKVNIFENKNAHQSSNILWNTYLLKSFNDKQVLHPQDDCEEIVWVDIKDVKENKMISHDLQNLILRQFQK